jgi:hypothetical protein
MHTGVMMGDPLTKVLLHLLNILVRVCSEMFLSETFHNMGKAEFQSVLSKLLLSGNN